MLSRGPRAALAGGLGQPVAGRGPVPAGTRGACPGTERGPGLQRQVNRVRSLARDKGRGTPGSRRNTWSGWGGSRGGRGFPRPSDLRSWPCPALGPAARRCLGWEEPALTWGGRAGDRDLLEELHGHLQNIRLLQLGIARALRESDRSGGARPGERSAQRRAGPESAGGRAQGAARCRPRGGRGQGAVPALGGGRQGAARCRLWGDQVRAQRGAGCWYSRLCR